MKKAEIQIEPWAVGLRGCAEGFRVAGTGLFCVFGVESHAEADVRVAVAVAAAAPPPIAITIGSRLIDISAISLYGALSIDPFCCSSWFKIGSRVAAD